jgi:hypothetical protein
VTGGAGRAGVRPDRGSGVVLALGLIATTVMLTLAVITYGTASLARHRAEAAADLAALAAASTASTVGTPTPLTGLARSARLARFELPAPAAAGCSRAVRVAAADGADLAGCQVNGDGSVTVRVAVTVAGLGRATAVARAGQPS